MGAQEEAVEESGVIEQKLVDDQIRLKVLGQTSLNCCTVFLSPRFGSHRSHKKNTKTKVYLFRIKYVVPT